MKEPSIIIVIADVVTAADPFSRGKWRKRAKHMAKQKLNLQFMVLKGVRDKLKY